MTTCPPCPFVPNVLHIQFSQCDHIVTANLCLDLQKKIHECQLSFREIENVQPPPEEEEEEDEEDHYTKYSSTHFMGSEFLFADQKPASLFEN